MKRKLAILENDIKYLSKLVEEFHEKYPDQFEVYAFTDHEIAFTALKRVKIDIFIADEAFYVNEEKIPEHCSFAYFVGMPDKKSFRGRKAIYKFQSIDFIYIQILKTYFEHLVNVPDAKSENKRCKVISFTSISGGTGSSTVAAACARNYAGKGRKVLYLNLESFGSADVFFDADGKADMSDVVHALRYEKNNFPRRLRECVKQDKSGVFFFSESRTAFDIAELGSDERVLLLAELRLSEDYEYIIVDLDFELGPGFLEICKQTDDVIVVGDGTEVSNRKILKAERAVFESGELQMDVKERMFLLYNKFDSTSGRTIQKSNMRTIGVIHRFACVTMEQMLSRLSIMGVFEKVI